MDETRSGGGNASQEKNTNPGRSVFGLPSDKVIYILSNIFFNLLFDEYTVLLHYWNWSETKHLYII